jgi:serine/threonine protein kinase
MGRVWRARDEVLGREVAIKELVPPPGLTAAERSEMQARSMREARAVARLNHPNVVRVFDVVESGKGDPWIVMEYLPGQSLSEVLSEQGTLPPQRVAKIGLEILQALGAAHEVGVIHRDVKPGNVLLANDGRAVLTDFGIATLPGDPYVTRTGLLIGSPAYIAPERASEGTAGTTADLWSLGATLYAATEGRPPFVKPSAMETLSALATEPVPPPRRSGSLTPVLMGLLQKNPAKRLDAHRAQRLLREAMAPSRAERPRALPTAAPASHPQPSPRRKGRGWWWALVLLAVLAGAALYLLDQSAPRDPGTTPAATTGNPVPTTLGPAPTSAPVPSSTAFQLPAGWQYRDDGTGFKVPVPIGWQFSRDNDGRAQWQDRSTGRLLLIDQSRNPKPDPVQDWLNNEAARRSGYRNYQRIRLEEVSYWDKAADWEFTYTLSGTSVHVLNRGFVTAPDQAYSIYWRTPSATWNENRDDLQLILDGFVPARS